MSTRKLFTILSLAFFGLSLSAAASAPRGRSHDPADSASITSGALTYYADCVNAAINRADVQHLDRHVLYRCHGDVALAYFNYLGRQRTPDQTEEQPSGVFIFRNIRGLGRCWNLVADEAGRPISDYGCAIFEQI